MQRPAYTPKPSDRRIVDAFVDLLDVQGRLELYEALNAILERQYERIGNEQTGPSAA